MTAELSVRLGVRPSALVVPERCVRREVGVAQLFVVTDGKARQVRVKTGIVDGTWVEVLEGLGDTDSVVVAGQFGLKESDKVTVVHVQSGTQNRDAADQPVITRDISKSKEQGR
jgi:multidrug efflux pump subunit AcrA (membrane-fusion protein)